MTKTFDDYWGGCPECGGNHGCRSVGPVHWYYCDDHKTKWSVGSNLFSCWKHMTEQEFEANRRHLEDYDVVTPLWTFDEQEFEANRRHLDDCPF